MIFTLVACEDDEPREETSVTPVSHTSTLVVNTTRFDPNDVYTGHREVIASQQDWDAFVMALDNVDGRDYSGQFVNLPMDLNTEMAIVIGDLDRPAQASLGMGVITELQDEVTIEVIFDCWGPTISSYQKDLMIVKTTKITKPARFIDNMTQAQTHGCIQ